MGLFDGKVVIVTGAGGGIGRAHALAFAAEGARVVVNDLGGSREGGGADGSLAERVAAEIRAAGGEAIANHASVATVEGGESIARDALQAFGRIDVLVNNAGIIRDKTFAKMDEAMWDLVMQVHTKQLFAVTQPVVRHMIERGGGGAIVNTTSLAGLLGNFGQANYATAKAGVAGFTRTLALEVRRAGIRVNAVAPVAKTRMTEDLAMVPDELRPEHISPMVLFLASELSAAVTGRIFGVHGNQLFEYKMTQTPGVLRDGAEPWPVAEIAAQLDAITADEGAAAPGGDDALSLAFAQIPSGFRAQAAEGWKAVMHWAVKGGQDQTLIIDGGATHRVGLHGVPTCTVKSDQDTVLAMFQGKLDPTQAFMKGKITADHLPDMMKMGAAFDFAAIGRAIASALGGGEAPPAAGPKDWGALIGKRYDCDYVLSDRDSIVAYALATNDPNPRYLGEAPVAPPLYAVRLFKPLMFAPIADEDLNLDMLRLVHGEQDMTFHGPVRPQEIVNLRAEIESLSQKSKGVVAAFRQYGIVDGEVRVEARMSVFVRGQRFEGMEEGATFGVVPPQPEPPTGEPLVTQATVVAMDQAQRYAAASGDVNPIHLDEDTARKAGLPGVILHGLCSMAFASKAVVDEVLGGDSGRLRRLSVRFSRMVALGETLTTRIWDGGRQNGHRLLLLDVLDSGGNAVISGAFAEVD